MVGGLVNAILKLGIFLVAIYKIFKISDKRFLQ